MGKETADTATRTLPRQEGVSGLRTGGGAASGDGSSNARTQDPAVSRRGSAAPQGQAPSAARAQADAAAEKVEEIRDEAENVERELARPDNSEKRIRDLQREKSKLESELETAREEAARAQREWPTLLTQWANEGKDAKQILQGVQDQQRRRQAESTVRAATQSEPNEIIGELLDSDDEKDVRFARFLRRQVKKGNTVTRKNLGNYLEDFEEIEELRANAKRDDDEEPAAAAASREAGRGPLVSRRTPPKVARPGSRDTGGASESGWKPGRSTQDLLAAGFAENDQQRGSAQSRVH